MSWYMDERTAGELWCRMQAVCHDSVPFGLTVFGVIVHTTVPLSEFTYGYRYGARLLLSHLSFFLLKLRPAWHKHATLHSRLSVVLA